jgi:hypothetical protein
MTQSQQRTLRRPKIAIGVPSRGIRFSNGRVKIKGMRTSFTIPLWTEHFKQFLKANNEYDLTVIHEASSYRNVAEQRNRIFERVLKVNFDYVFCVDDDVFIPMDALDKLLASNVDVIVGPYFMRKKDDDFFGRFKGWLDGRSVFELKSVGCGFGCCLIKVDFLRTVGKPIVPPYLKKDGAISGEDCAFFDKIKTKIYAHKEVMCDHYDYHHKRFFPEVRYT